MTTLVHSLRTYLATSNLAVAVQSDGEGPAHGRLDAEAFERRILGMASVLRDNGVSPGDCVLVALPNSLDFLVAFWAALCVGAAVAPAPVIDRGRRRVQRIDQLRLICALAIPAVIICLAEDMSELAEIDPRTRVIDPRTADEVSGTWPEQAPSPTDTAILQFTSGSTGTPKGCVLAHGAVLANALEIRRRTAARPGDAAVCWLPLHHDMGLMSGVVTPVVSGASIALLSTARFLANPVGWLRALDCGRPSHTAAPNFALGLVLQRLHRRPPEALRLDQVRSLLCGAEPINPALARDFVDAASSFGFPPSAFHAAYGMAEATVMAASRPGGLETRRVRFEGDGIGAVVSPVVAGTAVDADRDVTALGTAVSGGGVRIVDERGVSLSEGRLGLVQILSPSRMIGYLGNPEATADAFDGVWLKTADVGFVLEGSLHVLGRADDVVIVAGENIHPTDVEGALARALAAESSRWAVFGRPREDGMQELCVAHETRVRDVEGTLRAIRETTFAACGVFPAHVLLVPPGTLPRTTSGKIQRQRLRTMGDLHELVPDTTGPTWRS